GAAIARGRREPLGRDSIYPPGPVIPLAWSLLAIRVLPNVGRVRGTFCPWPARRPGKRDYRRPERPRAPALIHATSGRRFHRATPCTLFRQLRGRRLSSSSRENIRAFRPTPSSLISIVRVRAQILLRLKWARLHGAHPE